MPPVDGGPELVINNLYVSPSEDPQAPDIVVHFKAPFTPPNGRYRVAVVVGDPTGARVRASLLSTGSTATPTGNVELSEADTWRAIGPTNVSFDPSGFVIIRMPLASTPAVGAVWAEITEGNGAVPTRTTPYFDRATFFGSGDAGTLAPSRFGHVNAADGPSTPDVVTLDDGPVVVVSNQKIFVRYAAAPPASLLGQAVREVVDNVRILANFDTGAVVGDYIRINRTEGSVALYDGFGIAPVDKSGDRSWVVTALPSGPAGATTAVFDLTAAASALGITLGRDTTGVGLTRSFVLADGRIVTADGVIATAAWLELAPAPPPPTVIAANATTSAPSATIRDKTTLLVVVTGVLLVLLVAGALVFRARRRRHDDLEKASADRASAGDRVPWAKDDSQLTAEVDAIYFGDDSSTALPAAPLDPGPPSSTADPPRSEPKFGIVTTIGAGATEVRPGDVAVVGQAGSTPWRSTAPPPHPRVEPVPAAEPPRRASGVTIAGEAVGSLANSANSADASDSVPVPSPEPVPSIESVRSVPLDPGKIDPATALATFEHDLEVLLKRDPSP